MYFFSADISAAAFCKCNDKILFHFFHGFDFIFIDCYDCSTSAVDRYKSLLPQQRICFIYRVHIDSDRICKLSNGRKWISLL